MKTTKTSKVPQSLMFFDTETKPTKQIGKPDSEFHKLWFGSALYFRYEKGFQSRKEWCYFKTIEAFWNFVEQKTDKLRPLYVFAHNLGFDLTIVDFWNISINKGWEVRFCVLEDPPTFIELITDKGTIKFIDTLNYWRESLAAIGNSVGHPKAEMPGYDKPFKEWKEYNKNDVIITAKAVVHLMEFITSNNLGRFSISIPSQALTAFRTRFMKEPIYIHENEQVLKLERDSYHGGLVHNFFVGSIKKQKLFHLDVNSLYPFVMLKPVPTKLLSYGGKMTVGEMKVAIKKHAVVASVVINTKNQPFPVVYDKRLIEAIGRYECTLCGIELERAIKTDSVVAISQYAFYDKAVIFDKYVEFFYDIRKENPKDKNLVLNTMAKLFMNSLYGKFAQLGYEWTELTMETLQRLYYLREVDFPPIYYDFNKWPDFQIGLQPWHAIDLDEPIWIRYIGGNVQIKLPKGEHTETFPLISSYITAYAREHIRTLINIAKQENVFYTDTDSIFCNEEGYFNLQTNGEIDPLQLGKLKLETIAQTAEFHTPKDYVFGDKVVRKGIRKNAIDLGDNSFKQLQFEGLRSVIKRGFKPYIEIKWITKKNTRAFKKGIIQPNGRVSFIRLPIVE